MYEEIIKPFLDFFVGAFLLLLLSPILLVIGLLIKLTSQGPLFFLQERVGLSGRTFMIMKFRTMIDKERSEHKEIFKGDSEVTKIGYYLRRYKLDELPQIVNILKGDMSLVGPRPCLAAQLKFFNDDAQYRILVRPGMTGLAQVNGNIFLSWEERWKYDREYVENLSATLDLEILFKTIRIVLKGEEQYLKKPNV